MVLSSYSIFFIRKLQPKSVRSRKYKKEQYQNIECFDLGQLYSIYNEINKSLI